MTERLSQRYHDNAGLPAAWRASDFADDNAYRVDLSGLRPELDAILAEIRGRGWQLADLEPAELPLDRLSGIAAHILDLLAEGIGFCLLSGIRGPHTTPDEAAMLFWLLGTAMGRPMPQNKDGDRLGAVEDRTYLEPQQRGYRSREALTFHTDVADIVGLMCERVAMSGGESCIASALAIHDIMLAERPDLLDPLYCGYFYDRAGEGKSADELSPQRVPVFSRAGGHLSAWLFRPLAEVGMRKAGLAFSDEDAEAFDHLETTAQRSDIGLRFQLRPGEILLLNNYTILHSRTHFADFDEPERKRRLLRLWLRVDGFRPVDPAIQGK